MIESTPKDSVENKQISKLKSDNLNYKMLMIKLYLYLELLTTQNIEKHNKKMFTHLLNIVLYHFKTINYNCIAKKK